MSSLEKSYIRKSISVSTAPDNVIRQDCSLAQVWTADVMTLFPDSFPGVLGQSLTGRALRMGTWELSITDLRPFGEGKHKNVDDTPAGGGAGMVLRADVIGKAIDHVLDQGKKSKPLVFLSPRGRVFDQHLANEWAKGPGIILLAGRFEGVDQRVIDHYGIQEISLGDFVMSGGEIAAQAMIDACVRLLPGVIGNSASLEDESHKNGLLEHPQYTKPHKWKGRIIPDVLLSGNHQKIDEWRRSEAEALTKSRRPDLWKAHKAR